MIYHVIQKDAQPLCQTYKPNNRDKYYKSFKPELYGQFDTLDHEVLKQIHKKDNQVNKSVEIEEQEQYDDNMLFQKRTNQSDFFNGNDTQFCQGVKNYALSQTLGQTYNLQPITHKGPTFFKKKQNIVL